MTPKTRKYPSKKKTTTPEGYREYKKLQMRDYRKRRKEQIEKALNRLQEIDPDTFGAIFGLDYKELRKKKKTKKKR